MNRICKAVTFVYALLTRGNLDQTVGTVVVVAAAAIIMVASNPERAKKY